MSVAPLVALNPRWLTRFSTAGLVVLALLVSLPFLDTLRPPLQDLPQHLAAARVLLDREHQGFRFEEFFEVDWLRSQYLGTYVLLGAFFQPLRLVVDEPLLWANRCVLVCLALAWPLCTEALYRTLGRRVGLGAFAVVLFFNAHLVLGFLNFLLGITACFLALAFLTSARARERDAMSNRAFSFGWGLSALCCFYLHVVPFALLAGVVCVMAVVELVPAALRAPRRHRLRRCLRSRAARPYLAFLPAVAAATAWLFTPAGASTREAARGSGALGNAVYSSFERSSAELDSWLVDAFVSPWDSRWALAALVVVGLWLLIELGVRIWGSAAVAGNEPVSVDALLLWTLRSFVPVSFLLYFVLPTSYAWIWPINARFPLFGLLFLPLWFPVQPRRFGRWMTALRTVMLASGLALAAAEAVVARNAFAGFTKEFGGFAELIASIPPGQRTATLVFDRGSRYVKFAPFLHVGAYYQAERGGVAFFSFADFPQSPIHFLPERRPPRVGPRWEWMPERVLPDRDLAFFDAVMTRGGPGRLDTSRLFELVSRSGPYRVYRKRSAAGTEGVNR